MRDRLAFARTQWGCETAVAPEQFAAMSGKVPLDALALTLADMRSGGYVHRIESFVKRLRASTNGCLG